MQKSWSTLSFIVVVLLVISLLPASTGAQSLPPWQAAETLRRDLFDAQKALLLRKPDVATGHVSAAQAVFDDALAEPLTASAPAAYTLVQDQLEAAQQAVTDGDKVALALARGQIWGGLLMGGYQSTLQAVEQNQPDEAKTWLLLREYRESTRFSRPGVDATIALEGLRAETVTVDDALAALNADLLDTYQARLNQELDAVEAAAEENFAMQQAEAAGLAYGYWRILEPAYRDQLGAAATQRAETAFDGLLQTAQPDSAAELVPVLTEARTVLRSFRAAPLSAEEQARRAGQMLRFLALVPVEYGRGVHDGAIFLDFEIQEATTFLEGARAAFEDVRLPLEAIDPDRTAEIETLLQKINVDVQAANRKTSVQHEDVVAEDIDTVVAHLTELMPESWQQTNANADFDVLASVLDQVEAAVASGQYDMAESARLEAYAIFDFGPEPRLQAFAPDMVAQIDGLFWLGNGEYRGLAEAIANKASADEIATIRVALDESLLEAQRILGDGSSAPAAVITNAAVIVFREGLEAVVILAALMASLVGGYQAYRRPMVVGAILAFIASAVTWWVAHYILTSFARFGERLEAIVSLIAIGVLLLITNWFFHKVYWTEWIGRFHKQKSRIIGGAAGQFIGLMTLGFSSIYREGFETVLFLQALVLDAGTWIVLQGVGFGLLGVAIVGFLTFKLQTRLPYKKMLVWTGILIGAVLLIMVGNTVHVLQAVGWMTLHPVSSLTIPYWMGQWFGLYPTWESFGFQAVAAAFVIGSYYLAEYKHKRERQMRGERTKEVKTAASS